MLRINDLSCILDRQKILDSVSFEIAKGDFTAIIGINGSGKSTLLRCITQAIHIPQNTIFLQGKDVTETAPKQLAKQIAVVPQKNDSDLDFSAYEIVMMGRTPYQKRWEKDRLEDKETVFYAMKQTNTLQLKDRPVKTLSGGEWQRVLIARALAQEPRLLLLDEPVSHLDVKHQFEIMDMLQKINNENQTTVLVVLHDLNLTLSYAKKTLALQHGSLAAYGNTHEILNENLIHTLFETKPQIVNNNQTPHILWQHNRNVI